LTTRTRCAVWLLAVLLPCTVGGTSGCATLGPPQPMRVDASMPRELQKVSHPSYVIEPPDILVIDALRVVPLPPYRLEPLDVIILDVKNTRRDEPLTGLFQVQPE